MGTTKLKKLIETDMVVDITCDICNNSCKYDCGDFVSFNYARVVPCFGYGSELDDLSDFTDSPNFKYICEKCFREIFKI